MSSPAVSVLMSVYNAENYLPKALDSLLRQTLSNFELLVVDDASTDSSLAILSVYAASDSRIRVMHNANNVGQAISRNLALDQACGEFVCMLDADDWFSPDALAEAVSVFRLHPQADSVLFRLIRYWDSDCREEEFPLAPYLSIDAGLLGKEAFRLSLNWRIHGLYMVRRQLHQRYPFDTSFRLYSDDNTTHLHYLHSREVWLCNGVYYYRQHARSMTSAVSPELFLHIKANLSMRETLLREGVGSEVVGEYDLHRWHVYRSQLWLFFEVDSQLSLSSQKCVKEDFQKIYTSFRRRCPFCLYLINERVRWRLRKVIRSFR